MMRVFDLDGVLVDTREANLRAYLSININPPSNFHVVPWEMWTNKYDHDRKNAALGSFTAYMSALPLLETLTDDSFILSNCSDIALRVVGAQFSAIRRVTVINNLDVVGKTNWLRGQRAPGVFMDDSQEACAFAAAHAKGWQVCRVIT